MGFGESFMKDDAIVVGYGSAGGAAAIGPLNK